MSPARAYVRELLGFDPGSASPTSGYGDAFLGRLGLQGSFTGAGRGGSLNWHRKLSYKNRTAQGADLWVAAVVLAAEEDSWRHGERGNVALQAAAALVLASGDAWLVGGAP